MPTFTEAVKPKQNINTSGLHSKNKDQQNLIRHKYTFFPRQILQRKCSCGGDVDRDNEHEDFKKEKVFPKRKTNTNTLLSDVNISSPDDIYEKEADASADKIMRVDENPSFFKNKEQIKKSVQRKENNYTTPSHLPEVSEVINSSTAKLLDTETLDFMESRFGYDFSNVRIFDNTEAAKSASKLNALAYTLGNNIVFNKGEYSPNKESGKKLLAHELTHVVQQNSNNSVPAIQKQPDEPRYYKLTVPDYIEKVKEALSETNPIAGVGNPAKAYDILNEIETPELIDVLLGLGSQYVDPLAGISSPNHVNGLRTEVYIKAVRLVLMSPDAVTETEVSEVLDHLGVLSTTQKADVTKLMRRNKVADKKINEKYSAKYIYQTDTELNGMIFGNFDFRFGMCNVDIEVRVKFDFDSSIKAKMREPFKKRFFDSIKNTWNKKYKIVSTDRACSCKNIPININAMETKANDAHKVVDVHNEKDYREKVMLEMNLNIDSSDTTIAHEFGHVLGMYDEYDGGLLENSMFWHKTEHIKDKAALMNEGTELRPRYFYNYLTEVQNVSAPDCSYNLEKI